VLVPVRGPCSARKPRGLLPCSCTARGGWRSAHARMWWCWRREPRSQSTWWLRASWSRRRAGFAAAASSGARASGPAPCRRSAALRSPTPHSRRGVRDGCVLLSRTSAAIVRSVPWQSLHVDRIEDANRGLRCHRWQTIANTTVAGTLCSVAAHCVRNACKNFSSETTLKWVAHHATADGSAWLCPALWGGCADVRVALLQPKHRGGSYAGQQPRFTMSQL